LSSSGRSALLYSSQCDCVRVLSDLRDTPKLTRTIALPQGSEVRALAMAERTGIIAIAVNKVLLYNTESDSPITELAVAADALAFDGAGERLLAVEKAARRVHLVSGFGESPAITEVLSERDGLSAPSAVAFGTGDTVLVADTDAGVIVWNEPNRTARLIECLCKPSALEPTAISGLYLLSGLEHGAVWLFDSSAEIPRTFFVPAKRIDEESK
jgi:hypothetical protein